MAKWMACPQCGGTRWYIGHDNLTEHLYAICVGCKHEETYLSSMGDLEVQISMDGAEARTHEAR